MIDEEIKRCWPWSHCWTKWESVEVGEIKGGLAPLTDPKVIGRYEMQRRECKKCGKAQLRETRA